MEDIQTLKQEISTLLKELHKDMVPVGAIQAFAMDNAPEGWLPCEGQPVLREEYAELFEAIGESYGAKDNIQFNLPDLRGVFIRGWDSMGNVDPARAFASEQEDAFQGHRHEVHPHSHKAETDYSGSHSHEIKERKEKDGSYGDGSYKYCYNGSREDIAGCLSAGSHIHDIDVSDSYGMVGSPLSADSGKIRTDTETRPKNIALYYCIKARTIMQHKNL